jgi:hypothetical protein
MRTAMMEAAITRVSVMALLARLAVSLETRIVFIISWSTPKKASIVDTFVPGISGISHNPSNQGPANDEEDPFSGGRYPCLLLLEFSTAV